LRRFWNWWAGLPKLRKAFYRGPLALIGMAVLLAFAFGGPSWLLYVGFGIAAVLLLLRVIDWRSFSI
jgi:hypothetical protein